MTFKLFLLSVILATLGSCASKPPPHYVITDYVPQGARVEYYAQVDSGKWVKTLEMRCVRQPMHYHVAEKWALSAAQQRLHGEWKDYCFKVTPLQGAPVVVWQRRRVIDI